jgi:hypothetical protein
MSTAKQPTKISAHIEKGNLGVTWTQFDDNGEVPGYHRPGRLGLAHPKFEAALDTFYSLALERARVNGVWDEAYHNLSIDLKWNADDGADIVIKFKAYPEPGNTTISMDCKLSKFVYYPSSHESHNDTTQTTSGRYATKAEAKALEELMGCAERWLNGESSQGNLFTLNATATEEAIAA